MTPARVLMTCDAVGGVWRYAVDLARGLRDEGVETLLVGVGPRPEAGGLAADLDGIALEWLDRPPVWMAPDPAAVRGLPDEIAALARGFRAELVHLNQLGEAAGIEIDAPVVVGAHSCLATWWAAMRDGPPPADWGWRLAHERAGLLRAGVVLAPSRSHAAAMKRAYGEGAPAARVVPNACAAPVGPGPKSPFALAAGRWWDPGKNLALLDAAAALCRWPVVLGGALAGPDGARVEVRHARALGRRTPEEMRALMASAAIFVSPSRYEPFGLAALEAAHAGAALVLADIPTYRELWDGAAAFVDPGDPRGLAEILDALAADDARREALGAAARARAARHSPRAQMEALRSAYAAAAPALDLVE